MFKRLKKELQINIEEKDGQLFLGEKKKDIRLVMLRPNEIMEFCEFAGTNADDILIWVGKTLGKALMDKYFYNKDWSTESMPTKKEVILGMNRDPKFGPLMMFGMGGTMVEVLKDVSFYLAPLTADEAKQMLINTRTYKILEGVRGEKGVDIDAISEGLQRLSQLVTEFPQIQEMDINPYVVGPEGTTPLAVDARISVEEV